MFLIDVIASVKKQMELQNAGKLGWIGPCGVCKAAILALTVQLGARHWIPLRNLFDDTFLGMHNIARVVNLLEEGCQGTATNVGLL